MLWFAAPDPSNVLWVLALAALANFAFETGMVFYNAMLPSMVPPDKVGRLSGWGWGFGYAGGLVCLVVALVCWCKPDPPLFGLDKETFEPVRATALLVAGWFAVFCHPVLRVRSRCSGGNAAGRRVAVRAGIEHPCADLPADPRASPDRALPGRPDDLHRRPQHACSASAASTPPVTFGMTFDEILIFGIALNVTAGIGAFAFGWVDDWIGAKRTILIAVGALTVLGAGCW